MTLKDPDIELMLKFQAGDLSAFETLLQKYRKPLINFIYRFLGDATEAEDLAQEVFLKIYNSKDTYKPKSKFSVFLYKIAKNICLNFLRDRKGIQITSLHTPAETPEGKKLIREIPDQRQIPPDKLMEREELQEIVRRTINSLPEKERTAVILRRYEDLSYGEIAKVLGCSTKAVKSCLHRALKKIKIKLMPFLK